MTSTKTANWLHRAVSTVVLASTTWSTRTIMAAVVTATYAVLQLITSNATSTSVALNIYGWTPPTASNYMSVGWNYSAGVV